MSELRTTPTLTSRIRAEIDDDRQTLHTAMPARVESYDATYGRASVQPLLKRIDIDENGDRVVTSYPVINEVPVVFPGSGGWRIRFPITAGDVVLLLFAEGSLDRWLQRGGEVDPGDSRRHDINDAFAIPGLMPFAGAGNGSPMIEFTASEIKAGGSAALAKADALSKFMDALTAAISTSGDTGPGSLTALKTALTVGPAAPLWATANITNVLKGG
jgi:hypothetical protein